MSAEPLIEHGERGGLRATVSPLRGGKVLSLRGRDQHEWLEQPVLPLPPPARPPVEFVAAEMCGWDDCIPSIEACVVDGVAIGDHGDVWNTAWQAHDDHLSVALPHAGGLLERRIRPCDDGGLAFDYRARAGERPMPLLWAAHPQFAVGEGLRIEVELAERGEGPLWWDVGSGAPQPVPPEVDPLQMAGMVGSRKVYLAPSARAEAVTLWRPDGVGLRLRWDSSALPYLGVWMCVGAPARSAVVAIEPCTGWYDDLARALQGDQVLVVPTGGEVRWSVQLDEMRVI